MADCIFCKIIAGQIPAAMLLETDRVVSFLDINPVNPGHALIVPRRHVTTLLDLNQDELHVAIYAARRVAAAVTEETGSPAFNLLQNNGRCAGQIIDHVHFHVIPRNPERRLRLRLEAAPVQGGGAEGHARGHPGQALKEADYPHG